jgi:hypothetical protein
MTQLPETFELLIVSVDVDDENANKHQRDEHEKAHTHHEADIVVVDFDRTAVFTAAIARMITEWRTIASITVTLPQIVAHPMTMAVRTRFHL